MDCSHPMSETREGQFCKMGHALQRCQLFSGVQNFNVNRYGGQETVVEI